MIENSPQKQNNFLRKIMIQIVGLSISFYDYYSLWYKFYSLFTLFSSSIATEMTKLLSYSIFYQVLLTVYAIRLFFMRF